MPDITSIAKVTITRQTVPAKRSSFGTLLILGDSAKLPDKDVVTLTIDAQFVTSNTINGKVNGVAITPVPFNTDSDTTMADLATELASFSEIATSVASDVGGVGYNNTLTNTAAVADTVLQLTDFVVTGGATQPNFTIARTAFRRTQSYSSLSAMTGDVFATTDPEYIAASAFFANKNPGTLKIGRKDAADSTWGDALTEIIKHDNEWYALAATTKTIADVKVIMDWVDTQSGTTYNNKKLFGCSSNDTNNLSSGATSDLGYYVSNNAYDRSFVCYLEAADTTYPECAWFAECLSEDPGTQTWMFKQTPEFTASPSLSDAQRQAAQAKTVNLYETYGVRDMWAQGTVGSTEYIDIIRGVDWLENLMATNIFTTLATPLKVPYTDAGVALVEGEVRGALDEGLRVGLLREAPEDYNNQAYRVTTKKVADISSVDRSNRHLPDDAIVFDAKIAGAIHTVEVTGVVAV